LSDTTAYSFRSVTKGGVAYDTAEYVEERYPELFARIMEAYSQGKRYSDDRYNWGVSESEQYGIQIYMNPKTEPKAKAVSKFAYSGPKKFGQGQKTFSQAQGQGQDGSPMTKEEREAAIGQINTLIAAMRSLSALLIYDIANRRGITYDNLVQEIKHDIVEGKNLQDIF
jgi:hypothetical protein